MENIFLGTSFLRNAWAWAPSSCALGNSRYTRLVMAEKAQEMSFDLSGKAEGLRCKGTSGLSPNTHWRPALQRKGWVSSWSKEMEVCRQRAVQDRSTTPGITEQLSTSCEAAGRWWSLRKATMWKKGGELDEPPAWQDSTSYLVTEEEWLEQNPWWDHQKPKREGRDWCRGGKGAGSVKWRWVSVSVSNTLCPPSTRG